MLKLRNFALNSLLVAGSIAICVALALVADRWLDFGLRRALSTAFETNLQRPEPIMYVYDNRTGWRLNPLAQYHRSRSGPFLGLAGLEPFDTKLRVNSDGFIDREHFLRTTHYRIAFAGNSWLEAVQQEYTNRFAPLTEDYVFARSGNRRVVEVMNFGLSNAAPAHSYGVIREYVLKYRPDEIWLFVTGADLASNTPIETPPPFGPTFRYADAAGNELADIRFGYVDPPAYTNWKRQQELKAYKSAYTHFRQVMPFYYSDERNMVFDRVWHDMRLTIGLIKKTLDRDQVRMRVVYIPSPLEVDERRWAEYGRVTTKALGRALKMDPLGGERRFGALMTELDIEFVSLMPLCREKGAAEMYADHFSRMGHHWVAEYLAKLILETTPGTSAQWPVEGRK